MLPNANWREWYHFRHQQGCAQTGTAFEKHVTSVLGLYHDDFFNPSPAGSLGDGGCDGMAETGSILYACYGSRAVRNAERKLREKMEADFTRALGSWDSFTTWRFVTNAPAGPECGAYLLSIQKAHAPDSERPIDPRLWDPDRLWNEVVSKLTFDQLNSAFPGAPGIDNVELSDLVPLLDALGSEESAVEQAADIRPVPITKMDFNSLTEASRLEFNAGRLLAPRIDRWFDEAADPDLRDSQGETFGRIYQEHRAVTSDPTEVLERLYVSLGGPNIRLDGKLANAVYAISSYFFDSCHIFEEPPAVYQKGEQVAATN